MEMYVKLSENNRIVALTEDEKFINDDYVKIDVPEDVYQGILGDYIYDKSVKSFKYDGAETKALEQKKNQNSLNIKINNERNDAISFLVNANSNVFSDVQALSISNLFYEFRIGIFYKQGQIISYQDSLYRIGQDHTSQEQWLPGMAGTSALYSKINMSETGYEIWKIWDGVSGIYSNEQIVQNPIDGQLYISKIDNNVWGPPNEYPDYWTLYHES